MKAANIEFLEQYWIRWEDFKRGIAIRHIDQHTANMLLNIAREEFYPKYMADISCPGCVTDMFRYVFTQYAKVRDSIFKPESNDTSISNNPPVGNDTPNSGHRPQRKHRGR